MPTITIAFEELEEDRRRRQLRRRLPLIIAAALGAMALLAGDDERKPVVVTVVKPVRFNVLVPQPVPVPVPTEVYGPAKPVFVIRDVPAKAVPAAQNPIPISVPVPTPAPTPTLTPAPPPAPAAPRVALHPSIVPKHLHFTSSQWQRVAVSNPHAEPLRILSVIPAGINGAPVRGYSVDSRRCIGALAPGQTCYVTVFARQLGLITKETIEIRVNVAAM